MWDKFHSTSRKTALSGMLIALAFALSYLEFLVPLQLLVPIPGFRLGFANIVAMFALLCIDRQTAFAIVLIRPCLQAALFGTVGSLLFSLSGGLLAFLIMLRLKKWYPDFFSVFGVSMAGAAGHNLGQVLCAVCYFQSASLFSYLPYLLILSIPMGLFTGLIGWLVIRKIRL